MNGIKRNEIGSEFWDVPIKEVNNNLFNKDTAWFLSGRSALRAIIQEVKKNKDVSSAAIPSWCCDSMITPFLLENLTVTFYPTFAPDDVKQEIASRCDITLAMDYFGYQSNTEFSEGIVIRDLTHSVFSNNHHDASYYFGSLRKWCGFYTGGFAVGIDGVEGTSDEYVALRQEAMQKKNDYINGKNNNKEYLNIFNNAEELLDSCEIASAAERDIELANQLDVDFVVNRRRSNAAILLDAFADIAVFEEIRPLDCPLFVPIRVRNRDELRKLLIGHEIYCPVHWPLTELHAINEDDKRIYQDELSLVCDQRYSEKDMYRIVEEVKRGLSLC